ncbi:MAG: FkbM family methyltransferase [Tepidisphaeraceae bacterium]|jgi:FkbM family methyltransferase
MPLITVSEHTFFSQLLSPSSTVLDLGANVGEFATEIVRGFGCTVHCAEPSPETLEQIPKSANLRLHQVAIGAENGRFALHINPISMGSGLIKAEKETYVGQTMVRVETLETFASRLGIGVIDLLKIDIEGVEVEALQKCSDAFLQNIVQMTVEFHDFNGLVKLEPLAALIRRLEDLGFYFINFSRTVHYNTLFVNRSRANVSPAQLIWAKYGVKNIRGIRRMSAKRIPWLPRRWVERG